MRLVVIFLALAFGLSWLVALLLWLGDGLASPFFGLIAVLMMTTPAIAALVVVFFVEKPANRARTLGLWPLGRPGRFLGYLALAIVVPVSLILVALPIGALLGVYPADFVNFSGFQAALDAQLEASGAPPLPIPIGVLVALQLVNVLFGAFINLVPAMGEELGWRGWLLPKLLPLGVLPAILISGVIWGLWHAPLILLGYNYALAPGWLGLAAMCGMCIVIGAVFSWLRIRSGTVWAPALAHGAFNAAAGFSIIFVAAGEVIDTTQATVLGWSGWIVPLVLVIVLAATGKFSPRPDAPAPSTVAPAEGSPVERR
ncbi:MAG: CPBP family intramembrane glutamic endopeptidase [Microcella sp.]|uniref:CPBP family intramembrane glutamic endopeptidase n=1 Tax=Microcella sp. TaxID=1913979 RepID=UPI003315A050